MIFSMTDIFNNWNQLFFVTIRATFQFLTSRKLLIRLELETVNVRWYVVIGAEGILRCSTKSLLLLTINQSTIYTIHTYD